MKKFFGKITGSIFGLALVLGLGAFLSPKEAVGVDASVGNYNRDQSTYYTSAFSHKVTSSQYGTTLLTTLHELMYDSHQTYNTYDDLWDYTKYTDYDIDNPDNITLIYSRQSIDGSGTASSWNREHVWCKSLSGGLYTSVNPIPTGAGTDIHHLRPASTAYNSARGNTAYGVVTSHTSSTQFGDTDCYADSSHFEPADYIKGDVARILMYMYTHYSTEVSGTSTKSGALSITNIVNTSSNTAQSAWDLLMDWNESDPVDYSEMIRNNQACVYTGNYNPFIDHPEYARMIWDDTASYQAGLSFTTSYKAISIGGNYTNTASAVGNVSSSGSITYTSDNPDVATVNGSGVVTGIANGVTRIKARAKVNGIYKISYHFVKVGSGYTPKNTLTSSGVVYTPTSATTARASATLGSETVSFSNTYTTNRYHTQLTSGNKATLTITNFPKTISSIILSMHSNSKAGSGAISVTVGGSSYYSKTGTFSSIYGSYSESYVPVNVTNASASKKTGTIVIEISCSTNSFFFEKAIIDYEERSVVQATSINVSPSSKTLMPTEDLELSTSFNPATTTLQSVDWSSSNSSVATVNKYGLVRAVAVGTATISATAKDGSGASGSATITVSNTVPGDDPVGDAVLSSISVSGQKTSFVVGESFSFGGTVTANYSDGSTSDVTSSATFSGYNTSNVGTQTVTVSYTEDGISKSTSYQIVVVEASSAISASVSKTYYVGETIKSSDITVEDNVGNPIENFVFSSNNYLFTYSDAPSGGSLGVKVFNNAISANGMVCSLTVSVCRKAYETPVNVDDTMNKAWTGVSGNSYTDWSSKTGDSGAVYAGNSMGNYDSIQLRSANNNSGIVSTSSGGNLTGVSVAWNSNTISGRTLNIYGKNSAYSSPSDLYDTSKQGTLLGTIVYGTSTSLLISGDYTYIGMRSASGAMYLDSIVVSYGSEESAKNVSNFIMYEDTQNQCETKLNDAITMLNKMSSDEKTLFYGSDDYVISAARERLSAWALHEGLNLSYSGGNFILNSLHRFNNLAAEERRNSQIVALSITMFAIAFITIGSIAFVRRRVK